MREEIIGDCRLILGNCVKVMPFLPMVDSVICDPPYEQQAHTEMRRTRSTIEGRSSKVGVGFDAMTEQLRNEISGWSVENAAGWILFFCQVEAVYLWKMAIEKHGGNMTEPGHG